MDVKTAGRTVELFEAFARVRTPLTLSEIARELGAPQSSCFNLLRALENRGFLYAVGGNKRLYPTRKLVEIAESIAGYDPVVPRVEADLTALRDRTGETVIFGTRQGARVVYLAVIQSQQTIRYIAHPGELKPMHASAAGKALLLGMASAERRALVAKLKLDASTPRTLTSAGALLADLERAAGLGYATTQGEHVADVTAVACPVRIDGAEYALAVAGPIGRLGPNAAAVAALTAATAARISAPVPFGKGG